MQISTRGLLLVLVLGALLILSYGLYVVKDVVQHHEKAYRVSFNTPWTSARTVDFNYSVPPLQKMFSQPKANGLIPPPPPQVDGTIGLNLNAQGAN